MTARLTAEPAGDDQPDEFVIKISAAALELCLEWGGIECEVGGQILRIVFPPIADTLEAVEQVTRRGLGVPSVFGREDMVWPGIG